MGLTFIKSLTGDGSGPLSFVNGASGVVLDGTYTEYLFQFVNLHPSHDASKLRWRSSIDTGSNYGVATTTSFFQSYINEDSGVQSSGELSYAAGLDAQQSTSDDLYLSDGVGNDADQSASGYMTLFLPSSDTYAKQFYAEVQQSSAGNTCNCSRTAGYVNTTDEVDAIQFSFFKSGESAVIDLGTIYMYGVS